MLNSEHSADLSNKLHWHAHEQHEARMMSVHQANDFNLVTLLKPRIHVDGNQWCCSYGEMPEGIHGFGDTPYLAVLAFNTEWYNAKLNQPA